MFTIRNLMLFTVLLVSGCAANYESGRILGLGINLSIGEGVGYEVATPAPDGRYVDNTAMNEVARHKVSPLYPEKDEKQDSPEDGESQAWNTRF